MEKESPGSPTFFKKFTRRVLTGIITMIPLGVTVFVIYYIIVKIHSIFGIPIMKAFDIKSVPLSMALSILMAIISFYVLGFFSTLFTVKKLLSIGEKLVSKIPIIRFFYNTTKQIIDTMALPSKNAFKEVIMIEYPRKDIYAIAFITGEIKIKEIEENCYNIFLPTTPNPTSGFFLIVPKSQVYKIDMSIEEAVKIIMSAGIIFPDKYQIKSE